MITRISDETRVERVAFTESGINGIGVLRAFAQYGLLTMRPIAAGETLFWIEGKLTNRPSRYTVQMEEDLHIDIEDGYSTEVILDRYFWRFMNHSCEPNVRVRRQEVVAIRPIQSWEAIAYNYNTTEWELAEPFLCNCASLDCVRDVRGFKHLTPLQREQLDSLAAPYLKRILAGSYGKSHSATD